MGIFQGEDNHPNSSEDRTGIVIALLNSSRERRVVPCVPLRRSKTASGCLFTSGVPNGSAEHTSSSQHSHHLIDRASTTATAFDRSCSLPGFSTKQLHEYI